MPDREKVIKELECLPITVYHGFYQLRITHDLRDKVVKLLKERDAEWIEYPECLAYDGAYSDSHIVCSACKHVFSIMDNCTEEFDYCPHCGAKMDDEAESK